MGRGEREREKRKREDTMSSAGNRRRLDDNTGREQSIFCEKKQGELQGKNATGDSDAPSCSSNVGT